MLSALSVFLVALLGTEVAATTATEAEATQPVLPASAVLPIAQDEEAKQEPEWTGSVSGRAATTDGNTDVTEVALTADAVLEREEDAWKFGLNWRYSQQTDFVGGALQTITSRYAKGYGQYNHDITDDTYWLAQASISTDDQASIDMRTTAGVGVGHKFVEDDMWKASGEIGVSYFDEDYAPGPTPDADYIAARVAYNWERTSEKWKLSQSAEIFPSLEDSDDMYAAVDSRVRYMFNDAMFAQFQWIFQWDNTPAIDPNTLTRNDRTDSLYVLTVGWEF